MLTRTAYESHEWCSQTEGHERIIYCGRCGFKHHGNPAEYPICEHSQLGENLRSLAGSIRICRFPKDAPITSLQNYLVPNADEIAERILQANPVQWRSWEETPPTRADGDVVGRDTLGYWHLATHLIGAPDGFWAEYWMPVPFDDWEDKE